MGLLLSAQSFVQVGQDIDGEAANDGSGLSVSLSADGTRLAIGAPNNSGSGIASGQVRVFNEVGGAWVQMGPDLDGEAQGDAFGQVVVLSADGTRLAVGAPRNNGGGTDAGHVRVYEEIGGVWTQLGADIDGDAASDWFGESLGLSADGTRLVVGAQLNDGGASNGGLLRVFDEAGGTWIQLGTDVDGTVPSGTLGKKVAISPDGQSVAASVEDHVRVFTLSSGAWMQLGADLTGVDPLDGFGHTLAFSSNGTRLAIGAPFNDDNGSDAGQVRVFDESVGNWSQVGAPINGGATNDWAGFGLSLSPDGTLLAVGAPYLPGSSTQTGQVRLFTEAAGSWNAFGPPIIGEAPADYCGLGTAFSDPATRIAIGAHWNDGGGSNAGQVRVFAIDPTTGTAPHFGSMTMQLTPNPTTGLVAVNASGMTEGHIQLTDLQCRILLNTTYRISMTLDLGALPAGCYVVRLRSGERLEQQPLLIQR